jgi:CDP-glucose 4,6-dehydratase
LENLGLTQNFWRDRSVFLTGHTGFKGGWLALWLSLLGAKVTGYSLNPLSSPSFFKLVDLKNVIQSSIIGDVRNFSLLDESIQKSNPSIIFHLAAQPLVRKSYDEPINTFTTNVIGTANLLEASRNLKSVEAIINITTDKCYENQEIDRPYNESDRLGGHDVYSSSKACSELVTSAYRNSFFNATSVKLASARAGNVIGGGDWAEDRLIPDFFRAIDNGEVLRIRSPQAIRPWQHVLDPLSGYIILAEKLVSNNYNFSEAWNFGPENSNAQTVSWVLDRLSNKMKNNGWKKDMTKNYHEANLLKLDISKAKSKLGWKPQWSLEDAIDFTVNWYNAFKNNDDMQKISINQIKSYQSS